MSLHVPNKEVFHVEVVSKTKADVEQAIQHMVNIVDKQRSVQVVDQLIDQLTNFRRVLAGSIEEPRDHRNVRREDQRRQRQ